MQDLNERFGNYIEKVQYTRSTTTFLFAAKK